MPTLPLLLDTCLSRNSMVSYVSEDSSTSFADFFSSMAGCISTNVPFAHPAAAHILVDKDVAGFLEFIRGSETRGITVFAIRSDAVGRAVHQKRVRPRIGRKCRSLGHVDGGKQPHAVAHGRCGTHIWCNGRGRILRLQAAAQVAAREPKAGRESLRRKARRERCAGNIVGKNLLSQRE